MDFDYKVAEGTVHLDDVFLNFFHRVNLSSLACCSGTWLPNWAAISSDTADNNGGKDPGISDDWIADIVAFQTRSRHGVWRQPSFSTYFENSAFLSKPKTWSIFDWWHIASLQNSAPWQSNQDLIPKFRWQLVRSRVLRYRSISVQSRSLLPATCTTWFLSGYDESLVPNSW